MIRYKQHTKWCFSWALFFLGILISGQFALAGGGKCTDSVEAKEEFELSDPSSRDLTEVDLMEGLGRLEVEDLMVEAVKEAKRTGAQDALMAYKVEVLSLPVLRKENRRYLLVLRYLESQKNRVSDRREQRLLDKFIQRYRQMLVEGNQRLVYSLARKHRKDLDILDAISVGNIGLLKAIEKFDVNYKFEADGRSVPIQFSSYATWWIRAHIISERNQSESTIRRPEHFKKEMDRIKMVIGELYQRNGGKMPSAEEIAVGLNARGIKSGKLAYTAQIVSEKLSLQFTSEAMSDRKESREEDESYSLFDQVEAVHRNSPAREVEESDFSIKVKSTLIFLAERERDIVNLRYGLGEPFAGKIRDGEMTLEEVAAIWSEKYGSSVTRERIRQIEAKAFRKIKSHLQDLQEDGQMFAMNLIVRKIELLKQKKKQEPLTVTETKKLQDLEKDLFDRQVKMGVATLAQRTDEITSDSTAASASKNGVARRGRPRGSKSRPKVVQEKKWTFIDAEELMQKKIDQLTVNILRPWINSLEVPKGLHERRLREDRTNVIRYFFENLDMELIADLSASSKSEVKESVKRGVLDLAQRGQWL